MKKKTLFAVTALACALTCAGGLSACGGEPKHTHEYKESVVEATCTEGGYTLHSCACGDSYRDGETEVNPSNHSIEHREAREATCTETGWDKGTGEYTVHCTDGTVSKG